MAILEGEETTFEVKRAGGGIFWQTRPTYEFCLSRSVAHVAVYAVICANSSSGPDGGYALDAIAQDLSLPFNEVVEICEEIKEFWRTTR